MRIDTCAGRHIVDTYMTGWRDSNGAFASHRLVSQSAIKKPVLRLKHRLTKDVKVQPGSVILQFVFIEVWHSIFIVLVLCNFARIHLQSRLHSKIS